MKKTNRVQNAKEILARVKLEMKQPRLAESVREALEAEAALAGKQLIVHAARA
ncbi:MAG: hypothetical protein ABR906_07575 [Terracidiphilus sp.]